jgi:glycosyltransferase involved in cell wall biosynthesis
VKISVVVPAYNEEGRLVATLQRIRAGMEALRQHGCASELIVCDNNSTDRTAEIARTAGAHVVFEPVNQIARARNAGAAQASGDWLLFVDADSLPTPALFADVARTIAGGRCVAGGSTVVFPSPSALTRAAASGWNLWSRLARWGAGSFIFCDAAIFTEVGGFSLALYAAEEIDLFRRLKRVARRTNRRIVILHDHPLETSGRKFELYTPWELLAFMARTVLRRGRTLRRAEDCFPWYDGRR